MILQVRYQDRPSTNLSCWGLWPIQSNSPHIIFVDPIVCCIYSAALTVSTSDKESAAHKVLEDGAGVPCRQVAHPFDDAVASSTICSDTPNEKRMWADGLGPATQWSPVGEGNSRPDSCMWQRPGPCKLECTQRTRCLNRSLSSNMRGSTRRMSKTSQRRLLAEWRHRWYPPNRTPQKECLYIFKNIYIYITFPWVLDPCVSQDSPDSKVWRMDLASLEFFIEFQGLVFTIFTIRCQLQRCRSVLSSHHEERLCPGSQTND